MKKFTLVFMIVSLCLLQFIIKINAQMVPSYRKLHSAVLVEKKLYIFGGFFEPFNPKVDEIQPNDRFFYLDVSNKFDTSNLPWKTVPNNANLPLGKLSTISTGGVVASIGGKNNNTIFFINNEVDSNKPAVLSYNTQSDLWDVQNPSGERPIGRNQMRPVTDYNGKIYLLTGFNVNVKGINYPKAMFVFDTVSLNCVVKTDIPVSRLGYGATLLPNGKIVYMAGWDKDYVVPPNNFNQIYLYNTINDNWDVKFISGSPPSATGISSVLGLDGKRIIVYGNNINSNGDLYVLDFTNDNDWTWYQPKFRGRGPASTRGEHTATVIGKYMVIAFGSNGGTTKFDYRLSGESDILLLDISNDSEYVWTTSFDPTPLAIVDPSPPSPPSPNNNNNENNNKTTIIASIVGSIIGVSILSVGIIFFIRYKNSRKFKNVIPTPGDSITENENVMTIPSENELSQQKINQRL